MSRLATVSESGRVLPPLGLVQAARIPTGKTAVCQCVGDRELHNSLDPNFVEFAATPLGATVGEPEACLT